MTLDEVREDIEWIKGASGDDESAHSAEDSLRERVLQAIADGAENPAELARLALTTGDIRFARWCA